MEGRQGYGGLLCLLRVARANFSEDRNSQFKEVWKSFFHFFNPLT